MCGRFTLRTPLSRLVAQFLLEPWEGALEPRYNIAPSQEVAVVRQHVPQNGRQLSLLRWGLIPAWSRDPAIGHRLINARCETVAQKPSFRAAFQERRCLILADGYYEWSRGDSEQGKRPYFIRMREDQPFAFAGLWERWQAPDASSRETCTIITTVANELTQPLHPRMPVILDPAHYEAWLTGTASEQRKACLRPFPSDAMVAHRVSTLVNHPRNESPDCIARLDAGEEQPGRPRQREFF